MEIVLWLGVGGLGFLTGLVGLAKTKRQMQVRGPVDQPASSENPVGVLAHAGR
ncbi:MAG: hypothetical protein LH468_08075 [Nocardioides sp.]|nr:hypothetical protein [Nocardioides sp.]